MALTDWADLFEESDKIRGMWFGVAVDVADPELSGRVKARIPGIMEPSTDWARPIGMLGGGTPRRGMYAAPEQGALVLVGFEGGNPNVPFFFHAGWGVDAQGGLASPVVDTRGPFGVEPTPEEANDIFRFEFGRWEFVIDTRGDDGTEEFGAPGSLTIRDSVSAQEPSGVPVADASPFSLASITAGGADLPDLGIRLDKSSNTLYLSGTYDVVISAGVQLILQAPQVFINGRKVLDTDGGVI